jgi:hypothetical protein
MINVVLYHLWDDIRSAVSPNWFPNGSAGDPRRSGASASLLDIVMRRLHHRRS